MINRNYYYIENPKYNNGDNAYFVDSHNNVHLVTIVEGNKVKGMYEINSSSFTGITVVVESELFDDLNIAVQEAAEAKADVVFAALEHARKTAIEAIDAMVVAFEQLTSEKVLNSTDIASLVLLYLKPDSEFNEEETNKLYELINNTIHKRISDGVSETI